MQRVLRTAHSQPRPQTGPSGHTKREVVGCRYLPSQQLRSRHRGVDGNSQASATADEGPAAEETLEGSVFRVAPGPSSALMTL